MSRSTPLSRHAARLQLAASRLRERPQAGRNTAARFADALERIAARFLLSSYRQAYRLAPVEAAAWRGRHAAPRAR